MGNCQTNEQENDEDDQLKTPPIHLTQKEIQHKKEKQQPPTFDIVNQENFYVITCIFSPIDNTLKIQQYKQFQQRISQQGIKLITIEFTTLSNPFIITEEFFEPFHIQKRVQVPLFLKYNFTNIVQKLLEKEEWSWLAVIDYNVIMEDGWQNLAVQKLRDFQIVQLYNKVKILDTDGDQIGEKDGGVQFLGDNKTLEEFDQTYEFGGAWAFRKDVFTHLNGIIDCFVAGKEELFISLCLRQKCSILCQSFLDSQVIDYLKNIEKEYKELNIAVGNIQGTIIMTQILKQRISIQQIVQLMNPIFANLSKDKEEIFLVDNPETRQKLDILKDYII